jgi:alpha-glucosidase
MIPFTRMLAGPTDYHAGGFRAVSREDFKPNYLEPNVLGTRCHHLALYVVYESYLQMVCDYPEAYKDQPGFEFIQQVPTTWDETRVLQAQISNYITIARRKGTDWYIGTMNDWTPRTYSISLDFLPKGEYEATIFSDAKDADTNPNHLVKETRTVTKSDILEMQLAIGGGQAVWIRKK